VLTDEAPLPLHTPPFFNIHRSTHSKKCLYFARGYACVHVCMPSVSLSLSLSLSLSYSLSRGTCIHMMDVCADVCVGVYVCVSQSLSVSVCERDASVCMSAYLTKTCRSCSARGILRSNRINCFTTIYCIPQRFRPSHHLCMRVRMCVCARPMVCYILRAPQNIESHRARQGDWGNMRAQEPVVACIVSKAKKQGNRHAEGREGSEVVAGVLVPPRVVWKAAQEGCCCAPDRCKDDLRQDGGYN
jgi:hypothetical protein